MLTTVLPYPFQEGVFKRVGILVGMSLVQGGAGYPFFAPSVYAYICGKDICCISPSVDEVPDPQVKDALVQLCVCVYTVALETSTDVVHKC